MLNVVFYFQVHQPYRLKHLNVLDIGKNTDHFDDRLTACLAHWRSPSDRKSVV